MTLRSPWLRLLVASALLLSAGCATHSMQPLPGRLGSRLIVDNGVSVLDGRVLYLNPDRVDRSAPLEVPFAGATLDLLGPDGQPVPGFAQARSDAKGRFHFDNLAVGQPYFVRARLTDPAGKPRQLFAFVLAEDRYTCVELSLASTIVAQKIALDPTQLPLVKPELINEMIQTVRKTLAEELPGPVAPGGGPLSPPPAGAANGPTTPPPVGAPPGASADPDAPAGTVWVPGPNGGGYWWCPGVGGEGGSWWITTPCGGYWWAPRANGGGGAWWVVEASGRGAWQSAPAGARLTVPGGSCSFNLTPPPADNCGCVCVPALDGSGVYWFLPNADMSGGSWWLVSHLGGGGAWQPATGAGDAATGWAPAALASSAPGGASVGAPYDTVTWITLPGGGSQGYYWSPNGGPGGSWWIPTGDGGGYWWTTNGTATGGGTPPHACGCVWIQPPGSSVGHWWQPNGSGTGGSWYLVNSAGGGTWWTPPASGGRGGAPAAAPPSTGGAGGSWISVPGGGTDYLWIVVPGGGGYWWAPPREGTIGSGSWWVPNGSGGGTWWVSNGSTRTSPPGPDGGSCGCYWVQPPGSSVGYWYMPPARGGGTGSWYIVNTTTGGAWVSASSPTIARGGTLATPAPTGGGVGAATPAPAGGSRTTVVRWIRLPGGGGMWWYPWPGGGGGSYWDGPCGCWVKAPSNGAGYFWIVLPGGGGTWLWPSPDGHGACVWVPDGQGGGRWVWVAYEDGSGTPPAAPSVVYGDLTRLIDGLTSPTWTPGASTAGAAAFDRISAAVPALQTQIQQAIDTILNVNIRINYFQGVNEAPFPRKQDPKYLLIGTVQLRCALDGLDAGLSGVAYALNGQEICRTTAAGETWNAEYDTRLMPDGEYFLTAHAIAPGQGLGQLLAKGYARIRNAAASDDPCEADPIIRSTPSPSPSVAACSGPFASFTQGGWGSTPRGDNPGAFLATHFSAMTGGSLTIGVGRTLSFTSAAAVEAFLPAGGPAAVLDGSAINPTASSAGVFAGQLVAAKLNALRSDAQLNPGGGQGRLRDVRFGTGDFAGRTIGEVLALAERVIGGDVGALPPGATIPELSDALTAINEGFHEAGATPDGLKFRCP